MKTQTQYSVYCSGGWDNYKPSWVCARGWRVPEDWFDDLGFRCATRV